MLLISETLVLGLFFCIAVLMKKEKEKGLWIKLVLYIIIGVFSLTINQVVLPLGFVIGSYT